MSRISEQKVRVRKQTCKVSLLGVDKLCRHNFECNGILWRPICNQDKQFREEFEHSL